VSAQILDGQKTARTIRAEISQRVAALKAQSGVTPRLAAVLVGDNPASEAYVGMKEKACGWVGMKSETHRLSDAATQQEVEALIHQLNGDPRVHGILIQHPLPRHLEETRALSLLAPEKDVDGISRASLGALITGEEAFISCTPLGIIELVDRYQIPIEGKRAVVVGRSIILGKPVALLLLNRHATVTLCHSRTRDLPDVIREADILVAAVGRAELITGEMIKPGAVVIDAGYNRVAGRRGDVGDVHFESACEVASYITPVPGGVGPMTIAMLLQNTLLAAENSLCGESQTNR
jgi:methylenetetrahydrofolate dehydrogenase (NADP+)/methenyltetrahydrofolate cyclohydrolase